MPAADVTPFTAVVVVILQGKTYGLVVDSVTDVVELGADAVRAVPDLGGAVDTRPVTGLVQVADRLVVLLDVARLVRQGDADVAVVAA
jgi:purine-binding chemotaxis protein CheW